MLQAEQLKEQIRYYDKLIEQLTDTQDKLIFDLGNLDLNQTEELIDELTLKQEE